MNHKPKKEVQNLILMLSGAVFIAFIAVVGFVYFAGPSSSCTLRNTLVSPPTEDGGPFVVNKVEFQGKRWGRVTLSQEKYGEFYRIVSKLKSIPEPSSELARQFELTTPSTLTITIQARENKRLVQDSVYFQRVEFLDQEDVFRVQLQDGKGSWAYFRFPGVYKTVVGLFAPNLSS